MVTLDHLLKQLVVALPTVVYILAVLIGIVFRRKWTRRDHAQRRRLVSAWTMIPLLAGLLLVPLGAISATKRYGEMRIKSLVKDLRTCTRLEITLNMDATQAVGSYGPRPIDDDDRERLGLPKRQFTVEDPAAIERLASTIGNARYRMYFPADVIAIAQLMGITLYRESTMGEGIILQGSNMLHIGRIMYRAEGEEFHRIIYAASPQTRLLMQKVDDPDDLAHLGILIYVYKDTRGEYPNPSTWCDELAPLYADLCKKAPYLKDSSPFAGGICRYAMNPHCKPNSPANTVLLFQTVPGWNQHGGPELLRCVDVTPRGCNIFFNDGTYRFILEESLPFLKWR